MLGSKEHTTTTADTVVHACNSGSEQADTGKSGVQSQLYNEFKTSLGLNKKIMPPSHTLKKQENNYLHRKHATQNEITVSDPQKRFILSDRGKGMRNSVSLASLEPAQVTWDPVSKNKPRAREIPELNPRSQSRKRTNSQHCPQTSAWMPANNT